MRIKEIRAAKGISQRKAAFDLGLSPVVYGRYENGTRKPEPEMLAAIADYLGVTVDQLIGREDQGIKKEPAMAGINSERVMQVFDEIQEMGDLTDEEAALIRASLSMIKANRKL